MPEIWSIKAVKYQDIVSETCREKVHLKQGGLKNLTETTLVSECIFKMVCHSVNWKRNCSKIPEQDCYCCLYWVYEKDTTGKD